MATESLYLEDLKDTELSLDAPLPIEVSGGGSNWVATWLETKIEGEGKSRDAALTDVRKAIIKQYKSLDKKLKESQRLREEDEGVWVAMCHYIVNVSRGRLRPGEEFSPGGDSRDEDYKGPVFG